MTLILNEIRFTEGLKNSFWIAAADSLITWKDGRRSVRRKLLKIPYLNACISYFGIASYFSQGSEKYMYDFLYNYINRNADDSESLPSFCYKLREALNREIPGDYLVKNGSGLHVCGYLSSGLPDFWYVSNIPNIKPDFTYDKSVSEYSICESQWLRRDARREFGWSPNNPDFRGSGSWLYRNGDFFSHAATSDLIDTFMGEVFKRKGFRKIRNIDDYAEYVRFKFLLIAYIHKKWASRALIGPPVDILIVASDGVRRPKSTRSR